METNCFEWCKANGFTLVEVKCLGFLYKDNKGTINYIPFTDM